jgi:putative flippase GtrA
MGARILIYKIGTLIRRLWSIQILRFLVVGGVNTVFGYSVFALFILLGLHYVLAALLAQICGILFNFKTTGTLVFKNKDNRLLLRFFGVYLFAYLLYIGLLKLFDMASVGSLVAGAIIVLPMAVVSFLLMRRFVFITSPKTNGD